MLNNTAFVVGWIVMAAGGVIVAAFHIAYALDCVWRAWRKAKGFFDIVEVFEALREKERTAEGGKT